VEVRVTLVPVPRLRVRVFGPGGGAAPQARLAQIAKRSSSRGEDTERDPWEPPVPQVTTRTLADGTEVVTLQTSTRADAEGRAVMDRLHEGEVTLVTQAEDLLADVSRLPGRADDVDVEIHLRAPSRPDARVAITSDGGSWYLPELTVVDVTDPRDPIPQVLVVKEGAVLAEHFVRDRRYEILDLGPPRYLRWDGRATIELKDLETEHEHVFVDRR
jgi:hypothetical protein